VAVQQDAHRAVTVAGRIGMIAYGIVHLVIGWLAAQVALGSGEKADQKGAVETIAEQPFGKALLIVVAIGLVAFGVWQLYVAAQGYTWVQDKGKRLRKRAAAGGRGAISIAVAIYAVRLLSGSGSGSGGQAGQEPQKEFTARLLDLPFGRLLVGIVALAVVGYGGYRIYKGLSKKFLHNHDLSKLPPEAKQLTTRLGQIGYPAKGIAVGIIGVLIGFAAINRNPDEAGGLDKALHTLAVQPFGTFLLLVVALGFAAYGVFCFAAARSQRS